MCWNRCPQSSAGQTAAPPNVDRTAATTSETEASFKRNPVTPPRTASKNCSGLLLMAIRRNLGAEQLLALLRRFTGNHRASRKSKTTTSHCVSNTFSSEESSSPQLPTTRKSECLRKIRPSDSRNKRFSMSSRTLMSGSAPMSLTCFGPFYARFRFPG